MVSRRMNAFHPVMQLRDEMDRLIGEFMDPTNSGSTTRYGIRSRGFPSLNVWECGDDLYAEAEVPGVKSEDIDISVMGNDLTIRGRRGETQVEGAAFHRQERGVGEFNRVLRLPVEIDSSRVEASLKDGILLVKLPKAESAKPKKIKVTPQS
jgi:HSP20 family protein